MMSSELLLGEGKKPDYGAQIGVPGSVSNWDSSSTLQVELRARAPVYPCGEHYEIENFIQFRNTMREL